MLRYLTLGLRKVSNDEVGIVEKTFAPRSGSVRGHLIALNGEAGYQPDVLRGNVFWMDPFRYKVHKTSLVTVPMGTMAYIYARDGEPLPAGQLLAETTGDYDFQDVRLFLGSGGRRGPQRKILREGTYAINLVQFVVMTIDTIHGLGLDDDESKMFQDMDALIRNRDGYRPVRIGKDGADDVGIVTVQDGPALSSEDIIAPAIEGHNAFQDPDAFLRNGGFKGRQLVPILDGTYFINRLFATVELVSKTVIPVGKVGVVVSYHGQRGVDTSGAEYRHGEIVQAGNRGVQETPLLPGKYPWNPYAGKIEEVPTTNFVLKWMEGEFGGHKLDESLSEISLITRDAYEPRLPVSFVLHIDYREAPKLIQRFGDPKKLVEQTLDPMVSAFFKNVAQTKTLVELIKERSAIQTKAMEDMKPKLAEYSLELQEVLIGTPRASQDDTSIEVIYDQLRLRQVAEEQKETYDKQKEAAQKEREMNEAKAAASVQSQLTQSSMQIQINENAGSADLAKAKKAAEQVKVTAEAEASRIETVANANAKQIFVEGEATARAAELQRNAYGGPEYRLALEVADRFFAALKDGHQQVVPHVMVNGGGGDGGSPITSILSGLVANMMAIGSPGADKEDTSKIITTNDVDHAHRIPR